MSLRDRAQITSMDIFGTLMFTGVLAYVGVTIYLANQEILAEGRAGLLRWLLYGFPALSFFYGLIILQVANVPPSADLGLPPVDGTAAAINFVLTTVASLLSFQIIVSASLRARIRRILPAHVTYDPDSPLHTTAWVLMLALVSVVIGDFVIGGGIAGLAQSLEMNGVGFGDVLFEDALWMFAALLGVGLFLRRAPQETLTRLGLRVPTREDFNWGIGVGILLLGVIIVVGMVWSQLVSPEELQQQTAASGQFAQAFNSLPKALVLSAVVAIGEEVFFRGALQPVLGIWITSIFFAALHTQYTLTPATVIIFVTSLALGWLRERRSTSASIIAHFVYNFVQLALAILAGSSI